MEKSQGLCLVHGGVTLVESFQSSLLITLILESSHDKWSQVWHLLGSIKDWGRTQSQVHIRKGWLSKNARSRCEIQDIILDLVGKTKMVAELLAGGRDVGSVGVSSQQGGGTTGVANEGSSLVV